MVDLPVSVFGLPDAAVGEGVAGVIGIHAEVEVVTWVSHAELREKDGRRCDVKICSITTRPFSGFLLFHPELYRGPGPINGLFDIFHSFPFIQNRAS